MTPDRLQQIEELYHSAREASSDERAALLEQSDPELRREVESLLACQNDCLILDHSAQFPGDPTMTVLNPGARLGPYQVESKLGEGGMGEVFRAVDTRLGRLVAIKFAHEQFSSRFEREARAISSLNHPHICTLYDVGPNYLVMELLEGDTIAAALKNGPMPVDQALRYASQIAAALADAHEHGIVHRDLKPGNVMLVKSGVKVLDFGLATREGDDTITGSRMVIGTPAYMAPEQREGKPADVRTDIYSFGCLFYEMLTGARATSDRKPVPSKTLEKIVSRCLETDPARRWQSALELVSALEAPPHAEKIRIWMVSAAAILVALLVVGYVFFRRAPKLTNKDTIVLADFSNTTGDPVFDGTLRQGLAVELGQSPFLSLISDARIQRTLAQMKQPAGSRLTSTLAREICERTASAAVLEGSIQSLGGQYVLGLRAENCRTGDVLANEQARASRKEEVLDALTRIASKFRTRVGEALATVRQHETPLDEATTSSLEALKAYSTATRLNFTQGPAAAIPHLQRALAIDPQFAIANAYLGFMYSNMGESDLAAASTRNAYQLRDRTSDREKFFIELLYDRQVTGNLEREGQTAAMWAQTYPRDFMAHGLWAGYASHGTGKYEKAIEESEITIGLDPDQLYAYSSIARANLHLGRFPEVEKALTRAAANHVDTSHSGFCTLRFHLAFLKNDRAGMEREMAQARGRLGVEDAIAHIQALVLARAGRLQRAAETWQRAGELAKQTGKREVAGTYEAAAAVCDAVYGRAAEARKRAHVALELSKGRDVEYGAAFALAVAGDSAGSQSLADDLKKRFPEDTSVQFSYLPAIGALFALAHGDHAKAIETLQVAHTFEFGQTGLAFFGHFGGLHPAYLRGQAYMQAQRETEAAVEFQKLLDHPGLVLADPVGVMARLQLGRIFALSGNTAKAKVAYQDVLTIWKDADSDLPVINQARAEYAKLQQAKK
jgi:tetratricopeptide (TPR) repeat protein